MAMVRPRADTGTAPKEPHSLSLRVLRLSKPTLAEQHPLPQESTSKIPHTASIAFPSEHNDQDFLLSPNLSLPPAFGLAYVGESFSCSLCANNELAEGARKTITGVKISADMQTPSQTLSLPVIGMESGDEDTQLPMASSVQRIIRFDLKEEGNHVLIVSLTYNETVASPNDVANDRIRSFRKLYQFQAQPCLSVRTKATELTPQEVPDKSLGPYGRTSLVRYVLEAQLENVSESSIVLEQTKLLPCLPFKAKSLNWDMDLGNGHKQEHPLLSPRDVLQLAFLIEQEANVSEGVEELKANLKRDGRTILGQIALEWRSSMCEKGHLTTGTLYSRRRV